MISSKYCASGVAGALCLFLSACGSSSSGERQASTPVAPRQVVNLLAPGQSGFVSTDGQLQGSATGEPGDYGEHLDDQRIPYWSFEFKPGEFADVSELVAEQPIETVQIYRDDFGVPIIYAETAYDLAFGMGYALTADRLFLQDGARRLARGTLAELTGPGDVPADIEARVLTYSEAEYQAMYDALPQQPRDMIDGYVAGANAWIERVQSDPSLLPAEYALLTVSPEPFTAIDVLAAGVFITRAVASNGGNEFDNVAVLQALESEHGREIARAIFQTVHWVDDAQAAVTVPVGEGRFSNITTPPDQRDAVFNAMADYALSLPPGLDRGMGTGDAEVPSPLPLKRAAGGLELGTRLRRMFNPAGGASYMAVVAPERSTTGNALLINGPQLGYGYPTQLMELEVHGAGFDARGSTAPLLPVIGIGYGERTAWGVTTGNSKTIDSFIETLDADNPNRYLHDGQVKDMDCRDETVNYRGSTGMVDGVPGVPIGPASFSTTVEVCRTVHGPVVARSDDGTRARSVQYAMWMREVETIFGVLDWMRVDDFESFEAAMRRVTWNENTMYADADGNIAYWHPGLHPRRAAGGDQRFPLPGEGEFDHLGTLAFEALPQSVNPEQGYLANWNNKPAVGWGEGVGGQAGSTPAGADQRVTNWLEALASDPQVSFEDLLAMDRLIGIKDPRARAFVPVLADYVSGSSVPERHATLLEPVLAWDQNHFRPDMDITDESATDTVGATVFDVFVRSLRTELFADWLPDALFQQMSRLGNHEYDVAPLDNLALRILVPESSAITPVFDFLGERSPSEVIAAAVDRADAQLQAQFGGEDVATYTRVHHRDDLCSLTGVIGPCITMPHQDRGSWIHAVAFE